MDRIVLDAAAQVTGEGSIKEAVINADGSRIEQQVEEVILGDNVESVEIGGEEIEEPSGGGSGGGGGGSPDEPGERNIERIPAIDDIEVPYGTAFIDIPLPDSVVVELDDGTTAELAVDWLPGDYDGSIPGEYTLEGNPVLTEGITNNNGLKAEVKVIVKGKEEVIISNILEATISVQGE